MATWRKWLAALAAAAAMPAAAGLYSDLWWSPDESGWGVNVAQQGENAFVTLFVYAADGTPAWYVSPDARITAWSGNGGLPQFEGVLYRARGPWFGGRFDPAAVQVRPVGKVWLEAVDKDRMRLEYTVDGLDVVKEVRRQTFAEIRPASFYAAQIALRTTVAGGGPVGVDRHAAQLFVQLEQGQGFMRTDDVLGRWCEYRGPYRQSGSLVRFSGDFTCGPAPARSGTFELADLEVSAHGMTGALRRRSASLLEYGTFAATPF